MEILQHVYARGARWRIDHIRPYDGCQLLTLAAIDGTPRARRLLTPFDDVAPIGTRARCRWVSRRRWRGAFRTLIASNAPPATVSSGLDAAIDVLPHQLEPALAVLRGLGTRLLLADDVGMGKTIQAGLVVSDLLRRRRIDRVLVLVPAGLRQQWRTELERFALSATIADAPALRQLTATLPLGVNPWVTLPLAIASIDYVKRPEVLPAVMSCAWDLVIVDEAHGVVGDSERFAAVRSLAARSPYVLLLTATPHSGDEKAFAALCGLGDLHTSDRIVVFRRTRQSFGCGAGRRLVTLNVRPSARERSMFDALARYRRAVQAEHGERALALSVLDKRAYSSAWSLAVSVARRLAELANSGAGGVDQPWLPFDDPDGELTHEDVAPAWPADLDLADSTCERALLTAIAEAAQAAVRQHESKIDALRRLLRRCRESAIVFTEFRDTALHVSEAIGHVPVLHGGLTSTERTRIVDRFTSGERAVLVATDAAGQGLNLHHRCRLVINLELPWNPARIEQRIGRVERIGQKRRVHGVLLVGRSTGEHRILARLRQRTATASRSMEPAAETTAESRSRLVADAAVEAARLMSTRRFDRREDDGILAKLEESRWWTSKARKWRTRSALAGRSVHIYRLTAVDAAGGIAASEVIAVAVRVEPRHSEENAVVADHLLQHWQTTVRAASAAYWNTRVRRERLIVTAADPPSASPLQASLFNHRDERTHVAARVAQQAWLDAARLRLVETERQSLVRSTTAELLLVLAP